MNKGSFVKWPGGIGQLAAAVDKARGTEKTVVHLYRAVGDLYEATGANIAVQNDKLVATPPLPTAAGLRQLWNLVTRSVFVQRDVAIYAMLYEASDQIYERGFYVMDYYTDGNQMYAIARSENDPTKLYQFSVSMSGADVVIGEPTEVAQSFAPVTRSKTKVYRNAQGRRCFISVASTATINRVGEIDSMALYKSFEEHADKTGELPYLTVWHCGEALRCGQSTFVCQDEMLYITGGIFDDTKLGNGAADALERHADKYGVSIGFEITEDPILERINGKLVPIFTKGRHVETSILDEDSAASLMTSIHVARGLNDMNAKLMASLTDLLGGDTEAAKELATGVEERKREIKDAGLITREAETPAAPADIEIDQESFSAMVIAVLEKSPAITALNAKLDKIVDNQAAITRALATLPALDQRVREVEKTEDEKIEKVVANLPRQTPKVTFRPSQAATAARATENTIVKKPASLADVSKAMLEKMEVEY